MLKKIITTVLVVSTVATSSLAMAEPWHDRDGDRHGYDHRGDYRDHRDYRDGRGWEHRHEDWDDHRGHWSRGDRLPPRYRGDYVDWREHHLPYPPPRGHRWVRVNGDYLLIAIATGIITGAVLSR